MIWLISSADMQGRQLPLFCPTHQSSSLKLLFTPSWPYGGYYIAVILELPRSKDMQQKSIRTNLSSQLRVRRPACHVGWRQLSKPPDASPSLFVYP
ncbi:hypothetical protein ACRALDRAFT_1075585 [Sodiomyces alcalophilus JCM 7366]|uniref:uncharacterized protein n=1 Tax=Sodiomyces alcalophilus JCM 7366 TaxID=591952 RepID=UPI0039B3FD23